MLIILWLVVGSIAVPMIAVSKGRSGWAWGIYGFFLLPIALIHILVVENYGMPTDWLIRLNELRNEGGITDRAAKAGD